MSNDRPGTTLDRSYPQESAAGAICWNDRFGYAIAAKTNRDLLLSVAELVYRQTSPDGASTKIAPRTGQAQLRLSRLLPE